MHYLTRIKGVKNTDRGTELLIEIPKEHIANNILKKKIVTAELRLDDGRTISNEQRRKIFATIKEIAWYTGDEPEYLRQCMIYDYCSKSGEDFFSLSNCSMQTAREFINYIIDYVIENGIPLLDATINRTDDIDRYLYSCIKHRTCCVTGEPGAEIHHVTGSRIGMGNNRRKVSHLNRELIAISTKLHEKVHDEGEEELFTAYKVYGIRIDAETLRELGISNEDIS